MRARPAVTKGGGSGSGTAVRARAGGGGANWSAGEKAGVTQGIGNGAHTAESVSVRAWSCRVSWLVQAEAVQAFGNQGSARGGRK